MSFDPKTGGPRAFTDIRLGALEQIGEVLRNHYPEKPKVTEKHSSPDSALRAALQQIADTDQYPDHEDTAAELREIARRGLESVPAQGAQVTDAEARRLEAIDRADGLKRPAQPQAAPAQDDPLLPCDVALPNNTFIRKGCKLSTLFHALECRGLKFAPSVTAAAPQEASVTFGSILDLAQEGLARWKDKPHNSKWWRRIDGTPIPNDLLVNIAEVIANSLSRPEQG
jgi:hypothetical protein